MTIRVDNAAMVTPKSSKAVLAFVALGVILACGGGTDPVEIVTSRDYWFLNAANGAGSMSATLTTAGATHPVASNVGFCQLSAKATFMADIMDVNARGFNAAGSFSAFSGDERPARKNVVTALLVGTTKWVDLVQMAPRTSPSLVFLADGGFGGATNMDIYVTAPGASIATVAPDGLVLPGTPKQLDGVLHAGVDFQVRLTAEGTKNVVADFGTMTAIANERYRWFVLAHAGASEIKKTFDFDVPE